MKNKLMVSILILLFVASFFVCSIAAADESKTLEDGQGDVIDEEGNPVTGKDQYDIDQILYTNKDGLVTIEIKLHGVLTENDNITTEIYLITYQENYYTIAYDGIEALGQLITGLDEANIETLNIDFEGIGTSSLKFSFSLKDKNDKYQLLVIPIFGEPYGDTGAEYMYYDSFPDEDMFFDAEIQGPEKAAVGENVQFYCIITNGTPPYTYSWEFNNDEETDSEIQNPTYTFMEPNDYVVTVFVTDDIGGIGYGEASITITSESTSDNNGNGENGGSGLTLFIVLITVLVVAGIAVVVYLIRR
jgi:hypothetical protein